MTIQDFFYMWITCVFFSMIYLSLIKGILDMFRYTKK